MPDKAYELIEHTADLGIRVKAGDLKELFKKTALAMFDIMAEERSPVASYQASVKKTSVKQKADNLKELFINWLNELLSLSATNGLIFKGFKINKFADNKLEAIAYGEEMKNYLVNTEIKAATYHELQIKKTDSGAWEAEVIFDV